MFRAIAEVGRDEGLASLVDAVNDGVWNGGEIGREGRERLADAILARRGMPGGYVAGMFAPTPGEIERGVRVFTGERVTSRAGVRHVVGEEACRALRALGVNGWEVESALAV